MEVQPARYVAIPVSCPTCYEDQFVHIHARAGIVQMNPQAIECLKCHAIFDVMVPDEIIAAHFRRRAPMKSEAIQGTIKALRDSAAQLDTRIIEPKLRSTCYGPH